MVRKWGQMLKSKGIVRWILKLNNHGDIEINERNVSKHMPVNRMIEEVGFYSFEFIDVVSCLKRGYIINMCIFLAGGAKRGIDMPEAL